MGIWKLQYRNRKRRFPNFKEDADEKNVNALLVPCVSLVRLYEQYRRNNGNFADRKHG